jgi:hypothetical protein
VGRAESAVGRAADLSFAEGVDEPQPAHGARGRGHGELEDGLGARKDSGVERANDTREWCGDEHHAGGGDVGQHHIRSGQGLLHSGSTAHVVQPDAASVTHMEI